MFMGRTTKRLHGNRTGKAQGHKRYQAGIYARLSSNQGQEKESSIETQMEIAEKFVEEWNECHPDQIVIAERYVDLGKTGTNFHRDGFERLLQSVRFGEINCVIVKDLSRFARNYLEAGNYIEKIFPFLGVRFVAVTDGFDTASEESGDRQMDARIRNLIHEMYAKDSSRKAKLHLKQRREEGSYVGGPPPYGYRAVWEGRVRKLEPDEHAAEIVRYMFRKFIEKESYLAVADELNQNRINPPSVYKKTGNVYCPKDAGYQGWEKGSVALVLQNETYIGRLVQGKTTLSERKEANRVSNPPSEWTVKEEVHTPLIEAAQFEQAARIREKLRKKAKNRNPPSQGILAEERIFDQVLYCGVCGRKMTRTSYEKQRTDGTRRKSVDFVCAGSRSAKTETCPKPNHILKQNLEELLSGLLRKEMAVHIGGAKHYVEKGRKHVAQAGLEWERKRKQAEAAIARLNGEESERYIAYRNGSISQKEFAAFQLCARKRLEEMTKELDAMPGGERKLRKAGERYLRSIRSLIRWDGRQGLTKELVETLIERIYVYPGKRIEVVFSYMDAFVWEVESG